MLPSDPISAVADAVAVLVDDIGKPLLDRNLAQQYDNDFTASIAKIQVACGESDPDRASALAALASRVCIDNGYPVGGLGDDVSVPLGYLSALLAIAFERKRDLAKTNELLHALTTK